MQIRESLLKYLVGLAISVSAALSGYFMAYTGLRVELATKAEERYVAELDNRLARLEAGINERFASKDDVFEFKNEIIAKLTAIEMIISRSNGPDISTSSKR